MEIISALHYGMSKDNLIRILVDFYLNTSELIALPSLIDQLGEADEEVMTTFRMIAITMEEKKLAQLLIGTHKPKGFDILVVFRKWNLKH